MRALSLSVLPLVLVCACREPASGPRVSPLRALASTAPPAPVRRDPITLGIVVDQLSAWVLEERLSALPPTGGFARLAREGTRVVRMEYSHAVTDTAPGHASLYTGQTPRENGIFGNEIFEGAGRVSILRDRTTEAVSAKGKLGRPGSSPRALASASLSEEWLARNPRGHLVSVSWKDRGAVLPAGHVRERSSVLWFDVAEDGWVTSTAFANELPAFAAREQAAHPPSSFRSRTWSPLDPAWLVAHAKTADDAPGEGDLEGLGVRFDHTASTAKAMRATPFSDQMLLSMAEAALDEVARLDGPAVLLLSLSANDYVGHVFGPDSHEAWDELLRLDASLAKLFASLDARVGPDRWSAVLSADHGNVPTPETLAARQGACDPHDSFERPCRGTRMLPDAIGARLHAAEPAALGICDPWVFFDPATVGDATKLTAAEAKVTALLAKEPGVLRTYTKRFLDARCGTTKGDPLFDRVCASNGANAGAIYVVTAPGAFFDPLQVIGKGMSHGTPYAYDRTVPLFARIPGKVGAGRVVSEPVPFTAFRAAMESATDLGPVPSWATDGGPDRRP